MCLALAEGAAKGRAVFVLEGGYDLGGLAAAGANVVRGLLGERAARVTPAGKEIDPLLAQYKRCWRRSGRLSRPEPRVGRAPF